MRKVLMVLEAGFPIKGGGGAESQVLTLGKCLIARNVAVQVVVPMSAHAPQQLRDTIEGLDVARIAYPKVRLLGGVVVLVKLAWLLFAERRNYSFIHAHIANNMASICAIMGALLNKPVLIKLTGMQEMVGGILETSPNMPTRLKKWAMRKADLLQATSERIRRMLIDAGFDAKRIRLLPNGVDVARFAVPRDSNLRAEICGDASIVGIFVGRLWIEKGHAALLRSWASAMADNKRAKLILVGEGPERETLHALAEKLGVASQVVFAGHTSNVSQFLAISDFGLLTSLSEGLSNALLEYMAAGLPVIGSRVSGTEDFVVPGETGWLFEPGNGEELALCLRKVSEQGVETIRKMGQNAQKKIIACASLEAVTNQLMDFYKLDAA
jgi:L-malate glycosyltransferase